MAGGHSRYLVRGASLEVLNVFSKPCTSVSIVQRVCFLAQEAQRGVAVNDGVSAVVVV